MANARKMRYIGRQPHNRLQQVAPPLRARPRAPFALLARLAAWLFLLLPLAAWAEPTMVPGNWYAVTDPDWRHRDEATVDVSALAPVDDVSHAGGRFVFVGEVVIEKSGRHVLDFKNTSIIGHFSHTLFDAGGQVVARSEGGIRSAADNPFFLRHGRELELPQGEYRLVSEVSSPFFLAHPKPYVYGLAEYRKAIQPGNALALVGLGIFIGLGIYYAALSVARRRLAEGMYALFILGNLLFFGTSHLVLPQFFGIDAMYLVSAPILFSNAAYVVFVMALLDVRRQNHPQLYRGGVVALAALAGFVVLAAFKPGWSLELARYGVGVFLTYGLVAGSVRTSQGNTSAALYLVSITVFFVLGGTAISQTQLAGLYTLYIEHVGLLAVTVEVMLLALVLASQFAQMRRERDEVAQRLAQSDRMAYSDALTGLSNRYALDLELDRLPRTGSLTFLDLDNLKYYNDHFGHDRGDDLLRTFAAALARLLGSRARVHRTGGDEFAVTCPQGDVEWVEHMVAQTVANVRSNGFEFAGASAGSACVSEAASLAELKRIADARMYENKRHRRLHEPRPSFTSPPQEEGAR